MIATAGNEVSAGPATGAMTGRRDVVIRVRGLKVGFGAKLVMDGLDLDILRGEVLGFVGASGAGKSVLTRAILGLRARGAIVIVVAHRPSAIAGVDYILVMAKGRQQQFGPKEEILNRVTQAPSTPARALKVVPGEGGAG